MDGKTTLEFGNLAVEVPRREALAQQFPPMHLGLDATSSLVSACLIVYLAPVRYASRDPAPQICRIAVGTGSLISGFGLNRDGAGSSSLFICPERVPGPWDRMTSGGSGNDLDQHHPLADRGCIASPGGGIDISKPVLDAFRLSTGEHRQFPKDHAGCCALARCLMGWGWGHPHRI